jgi:GxxExxY protein
MTELLYKDEVYAIVGAAMEAYNDLGPGFLEPVYQEAMEMELEIRNIPYKAQHQIIVTYKGRPLKKYYIADLFCYEKIVIEIKTMNSLTLREEGQLLNYLKATEMMVGVLVNFGHYPGLEWKRLVFTRGSNLHNTARLLREEGAIYQLEIGEN